MLELGQRVLEIIIRDSHLECVNIFTDFQLFPNLRRLTLTRSHVKDLHNCNSTATMGTDSINRQQKIPADALHSLEVLDLSGNLLTRSDSIK